MASNCPIAPTRLREICDLACSSALSSATHYEHAHTQAWNNAIINSILKALIAESTSSSSTSQSTVEPHQQQRQEEQKPKYKFAVNSTIIQHLSDAPRAPGAGPDAEERADGELKKDVEEKLSLVSTQEGKKVGRRGMHSASGAYWNNEKDGMWSHKYEGGEAKGVDIVISIMWIAV